MISFTTTILKFAKKGEKTGWSYIVITASQAQKLNPGCKVSFRVKGKLDDYSYERVALMPMGDGSFILPINAEIRKATKKSVGDHLKVTMEFDQRPTRASHDLIKCLEDDKVAMDHFVSLPKSHQNYISKWIESAKTTMTKTKRIVIAVAALSRRQGFREMMRANKTDSY
jgi:hypothetical protein